MVSLSPKTIYTVKDIYELPDGERAELIDGEIYKIEKEIAPGRMVIFEDVAEQLLDKYIRKQVIS